MMASEIFTAIPFHSVDSQYGEAVPYTKRGSQEPDRPLPLPESTTAR